MGTKVGSPVQACPLKSHKLKDPKQQKHKQFIKFRVLDKPGKPVADVTFHVRLPDKKIAEVTSDEKGLIEINNIDPGVCTVKLDFRKVTVTDCVLFQG